MDYHRAIDWTSNIFILFLKYNYLFLMRQKTYCQLSIEQVIELAKTLAASGAGSLHVSFADGNAQNNKIASFCTSEKKLNFASVRRLKSYSRVIKGELYENYYCRCG